MLANYKATLADKLVGIIQEANAQLVVRIDDAQGTPLAALVTFQCHGTVLAYENKLLSPDWIGMTRKVVEEALPGAKCLYFQGAAGNQGPIEGFTGDVEVA